MSKAIPTRRPEGAGHLQAEFVALLPKVENAVRVHLRHITCPDRRSDLTCEAVALAWVWYVRLAQKGRSPAGFLVTFGTLAARAALGGRRLCGCERARDVFSPVCRWRRGVTVSPLPDGSSVIGHVFDEALIDNTRTPVPDQVQFRLDFPRWRASLGARRRALVDALAAGHRTADVADMFGVSHARVSQVRRECYDGWRAFCGDDRG